MTRRVLLLAVVALAGIACDKGPTDPSLNLAGAWTGSLTFVTSGVTITDTVTTTLTQSGSSVTGAWTSESGTSGQFTLTADADMTGSTTIAQTTITGQACNASAALTGTATANRIELSLAPITPTGVCQWATSQRFVLTR